MSEKPASYQSIFVERFNFLPCCGFVCVCVCFSFPRGEKEIKKKAMGEKIRRIKNLTANKEKECLGRAALSCPHFYEYIFLAPKGSSTSIRIWRGGKRKAGSVNQRNKVWHSYTIPSNSERLCKKHQQPHKTNYGSTQGACNLWPLARGSFLVSAYCAGKWGWVASPATRWVSWSSTVLPWRENQDAVVAGSERRASVCGRTDRNEPQCGSIVSGVLKRERESS